MLSALIQNDLLLFGFLLLVPIALAAGALVSFFAVGALFDALDDPEALQARIDGLFRRPPREPKPAGDRHYYRAWWRRA